jgi:hypothetical protein
MPLRMTKGAKANCAAPRRAMWLPLWLPLLLQPLMPERVSESAECVCDAKPRRPRIEPNSCEVVPLLHA